MNTPARNGVIILAAALAACSTLRTSDAPATRLAQGEAVFRQTCALCHSVEPPAIAAPPMSHVARHYLQAAGDSAAAVRRVVKWLEAPSVDASALPAHAIEQWGLMPPLQLTAPQRDAVALYVMTLSLAPAVPGSGMGAGGGMGTGMRMGGGMGRGGMQHETAGPLQATAAEEQAVTALAAPAAAALRTGLSQRLVAAMQAGGPAAAIDVCARDALTLTDSIAKSLGTGIDMKRTSLRIRNPANAPDALEYEALAWFELEMKQGRTPASRVQKAGDEFRYYVPLPVMDMCTSCHGPAESITPDVLRILRERYPDDRATGYLAGEVRGLLRVTVPASALR